MEQSWCSLRQRVVGAQPSEQLSHELNENLSTKYEVFSKHIYGGFTLLGRVWLSDDSLILNNHPLGFQSDSE